MNQPTKADAARILREIATLMLFHNENPFKVRAFENAATALLAEPRALNELARPGGGLEKIKGIGKGTADVIREINLTGDSVMRADLAKGTPAGLAELLRVPNLGVKKIAQVYAELGVSDLDSLEAACTDGRIAALRGFTAKSAEKILAGIDLARRSTGLMLLSTALTAAQPILAALRAHPAVKRAEVAGSLRRRKEVVGDLDFVASSDDPEALMKFFTSLPQVQSIMGQGGTKASVLLDDDLQADLRVVPDAQFATTLHHFTGSKEHNTLLRARAVKMGLKVNEYGVFREDDAGETPLPVTTEEELFRALGLAYIEPELREGQGEIEAAEAGTLPRLIERADYAGVLHCHTTWSDGVHSILQMATAARDTHGWQYFAVCDHSEAAAYAGGVKKGDIAAQHEEIDEVNAALATDSFRVLKGCECDIMGGGSMDYPDEILAKMDVVVASIHSRFQLPAEAMTERIIRAMENPYVTMIGHVSGRLLLGRDPYQFDVDAVLKAAARTRTVMEINADPRRLDLDWRFCRRARELGVMFSINPDAHKMETLAYVDYGVSMARKGWLRREDVINCLPLEEFLQWCRKQREFKLGLAAE